MYVRKKKKVTRDNYLKKIQGELMARDISKLEKTKAVASLETGMVFEYPHGVMETSCFEPKNKPLTMALLGSEEIGKADISIAFKFSRIGFEHVDGGMTRQDEVRNWEDKLDGRV